MSKTAATETAEDMRSIERGQVVATLRDVMAWLDANNEPFAAGHVNQAIETLDPTPFVTLSEKDSLN